MIDSTALSGLADFPKRPNPLQIGPGVDNVFGTGAGAPQARAQATCR